MSNLTAAKADVIKEYDNGSTTTKKLLRKIFPGESFDKGIMDKVKTFEDACKLMKLTPAKVTSSIDTKDEAAYKKLKVIAAALNQGWKPDWSNTGETKYYPWFKIHPKSGLGLSCDGYVVTDSYSRVGSRLCFKSEELAVYAGKQFTAIYADYMTK